MANQTAGSLIAVINKYLDLINKLDFTGFIHWELQRKSSTHIGAGLELIAVSNKELLSAKI